MNPLKLPSCFLRPVEALLLVVSLALFPGMARAAKWQGVEKLPNATPIVLLVQAEPRNYFRITVEKPLIVPVTGPSRLRIISRTEFLVGSPEILSYKLRALESGKVMEEEVTESSPSDLVRLENDDHPIGKSRKFTIDIPPGEHRVELRVESVSSVLVRLQTAAPAKGEETMVSLTPYESGRSLLLTEGEKTIPYYSAFPGKPVKIKVIGPTRLDILSRLDFDATMRGEIRYRLAVREGSKTLGEEEFKATKSTTAIFPDARDLIPSKFHRMMIPIPEGPHDLSIVLLSPSRGSVEIHARIPEPTIGNEQ